MDPMTMMTIAKTGMEFIQAGKKAREDQARYNANRIAAVAARDLKIGALTQRAIQESEVVADDKMALAIKALETRESQVVAAGEAGVSGKSIQQQIDLTEARRLRGMSKYNKTIDNLLTQVELEGAGLNAEALNNINRMQQGQPPSLMAAVVSGVTSVAMNDIKYGDGKLFGIDLVGDKAVKDMITTGVSTTKVPSNVAYTPSFASTPLIDGSTGF
tara:strand:- start:854 stop:1501 length:648 start_codon:yes stop_codon:yes gene_type:complete